MTDPTRWDITSESGAWFSQCDTYRYGLWRMWGKGGQLVNFVALNPSTADAHSNDPTIRRCIGFAKGWGYDGFLMTNLFAYRAADPKEMRKAEHPVGPDNNAAISVALILCKDVVLCWGAGGSFKEQGDKWMKVFNGQRVYHLGLTKQGQPKHPLYLKKTTERIELSLESRRD